MTKVIRQTETKSYIKQALAQLLKKKSFEEISVTMICRQAGINRGTFYLHYLDKYDMMDKMKEETLSHIYDIITEETQSFSKEVVFAALQFIYDDFDFIAILSGSTYVNLHQSIRNFIASILANVPYFENFLKERYGIPIQYAITVYIASIEAIISQWIADGGKETPEEMAEIIYHISN